MTDEKLCPIMSKPALDTVKDQDGSIRYYAGELMEVLCQQDRCMAWGGKAVRNTIDECRFDWEYGCRLIP